MIDCSTNEHQTLQQQLDCARFVSCERCQTRVLEKHLVSHLETACIHASTECAKCGANVWKSKMAVHLQLICGRIPRRWIPPPGRNVVPVVEPPLLLLAAATSLSPTHQIMTPHPPAPNTASNTLLATNKRPLDEEVTVVDVNGTNDLSRSSASICTSVKKMRTNAMDVYHEKGDCLQVLVPNLSVTENLLVTRKD
jgi:hypothetical protein